METLSKVLTGLGYGDYALIILFLSIFIDITPGIKFNPIKAIFRYLGKSFNASMEEELSNFKKDVDAKFTEFKNEQQRQKHALDKIILDRQDQEITRLRWEIINFDNGLKNKVKHSPDQYRHILNCFSRYKIIMNDIGSHSDEYYHDVIMHGNHIERHFNDNEDSGEAFF